MNLPDWLRSDTDYVPDIPPNPELEKAIQRYKDHFGMFDLNTMGFYSEAADWA